ncbi:aldo/keto reductase [Flexivirga oryzae]|uniref:Diketogulonate reductase-like aldo/keto reductase n=1 Tax=Flexivirga oryzae TaxID=1794944 RepID=A0A839NC00_9MICO|nr:aldo/keto reductase [Flexivirga oryzae]MBB2894389.1 diketogulonate reductase-like aldo/keto reductase [Flexivirga oryzae]
MANEQPHFTLNNGVELPQLGFGVYQTPPDETAEAVQTAFKAGYRHIDTAAAYGNEKGVGEALRRSGLDRSEVFIETKVWVVDYGYEQTLHAFEKGSAKLGIDQIDLLILHQAYPKAFGRTIQAYKALETLLVDGKVRAIGVSNFLPERLERLLNETDVVPAVNQIEVHPYTQQRELQAFDREHGILTQAWSPIGGLRTYGNGDTPLSDPTIAKIARAHGKTPAQVMLRWHLQEGRQVIPKSVRPTRIAENFDVFDFELTPDEVAGIDALEQGMTMVPDQLDFDAFRIEIPEA